MAARCFGLPSGGEPHTLEVTGQGIHPAALVQLLDALQKNSAVTSLNLYGNNIGDDGAKAIADHLQGSSITNLNLSLNAIGDDGATAIADHLQGSSITSLNLDDNNISAEVMDLVVLDPPEAEAPVGSFPTLLRASEYGHLSPPCRYRMC